VAQAAAVLAAVLELMAELAVQTQGEVAVVAIM
jgi:hypothetical protein